MTLKMQRKKECQGISDCKQETESKNKSIMAYKTGTGERGKSMLLLVT
jgi:hypothetical protein